MMYTQTAVVFRPRIWYLENVGRRMHVLIIEDDRPIAQLLSQGFREEGYLVDHVANGRMGLEHATTQEYDVIILDILLPDISGRDVCRRVREAGITTPIVMLTAKSTLDDKLAGFAAGADDYLAKPFAFAELQARVKAVLRRQGGASAVDASDVLEVHDLVMDRRRHVVERAGVPVTLSPKEYALLEYLLQNTNQVLSRTLILDRVWGYNGDTFANVVDVTIRRLRRAIDDQSDPPLIQTVRGIGYRLQP